MLSFLYASGKLYYHKLPSINKQVEINKMNTIHRNLISIISYIIKYNDNKVTHRRLDKIASVL